MRCSTDDSFYENIYISSELKSMNSRPFHFILCSAFSFDLSVFHSRFLASLRCSAKPKHYFHSIAISHSLFCRISCSRLAFPFHRPVFQSRCFIFHFHRSFSALAYVLFSCHLSLSSHIFYYSTTEREREKLFPLARSFTRCHPFNSMALQCKQSKL